MCWTLIKNNDILETLFFLLTKKVKGDLNR